MFNLEQLQQASNLIHQVMPATPSYCWPQLSKNTGCEVWVKHENHTPTTAFKVRGGIYLLDQLNQSKDKPAGIISATRGNHGQSLAFSGARTGMPVVIVAPECNSPDQNRAIEAFGAELILHGKDFEQARQYSVELKQQYGYQQIPPFCRELVTGVASYALEFFSAVKNLDAVYVPVGMGSGICGLIKTRDLLGLDTEIIGVVSEGAPTFYQSFQAGKIIATDGADTIADGVATSSPTEDAFEIILKGASRIVMVSDSQIAEAMYHYYKFTHNLAEGAGACALAGLNHEQQQMKGKKVGVILSGGNIDFNRFQQYVTPFL
ncbi:MAG: threonine dehydratase [Gammaproteobacteria bacterium]|nr:MAG: threonine dehydratase [Gammaproteobacteria bacterium]